MSLVTDTNPGRLRRGLLALLLAGTLLLCLGDFWASHACSASEISSADLQASGHHSLAGTGAADHEQPWCSPRAVAGHFAVLLTVFLGLILWLLLRGVRSWGTGMEPQPVEHRLRAYYTLCSIRGPELALIQVFRL